MIRALEPQAGMAKMQQRRHQEGVGLTNGPGKLCQALAIDRAFDGSRLNAGGLQLTATTFQPRHITIGPRIGIPNKEPWTSAPLRFSVQGNPFVSGTARRDQDLKRGMAIMSQINMLDAIGDKMDALDFDGDLSLNWDKDAHVIEL